MYVNVLLKVAYLLNIVILSPVLFVMYSDSADKTLRAFEGKVQNSDGLRLLVCALWSAIWMLSVLGLLFPRFFIPVLMLQVIYKFLYLSFYVAPQIKRGKVSSIPIGITISFVFIVLVYPVIIWLGCRG